MSEEKNLPGSRTDLSGVASDPLDDLLLKMFRNKEINSLSESEVDLEKLTQALTKEDVEALASLGSPEDLIEEIMASGSKQLELLTVSDSLETIAEPNSEFCIEASTKEFDRMKDDLTTLKNQERLLFQSEYRKTRVLGRGGQGVVYLVEGEDEFSASCALKLFEPEAYGSPAAFVADMKRMKPIASMIHHDPHDDLVDIAWFGKYNGVYAMLMQYIDGFDLRRLLHPERLQDLRKCVNDARWQTINNVIYSVNGSQQLALQPAIAVYIIERVLRGVEALHSRGIVHGDIKPSNIMLNASGSVKIIDVGSAFEITSPPTEYHVTPAYAAPEFLRTGAMSKQSDLASVGYVLLELLSGASITDEVGDSDVSTRTIGGPGKLELLHAKTSLPDRLEDILPEKILGSNHLVELCRRLIEPDLSQRFPSAAETIVDRKGTYEFNKDLILSNLGVCNFQEVRQWLADAKEATRSLGEDSSLPR